MQDSFPGPIGVPQWKALEQLARREKTNIKILWIKMEKRCAEEESEKMLKWSFSYFTILPSVCNSIWNRANIT